MAMLHLVGEVEDLRDEKQRTLEGRIARREKNAGLE